MTKAEILKSFEQIIPRKIDLIFDGHTKVLCSRQAIVNYFSTSIDKLLDSIEGDIDCLENTREVNSTFREIKQILNKYRE